MQGGRRKHVFCCARDVPLADRQFLNLQLTAKNLEEGWKWLAKRPTWVPEKFNHTRSKIPLAHATSISPTSSAAAPHVHAALEITEQPRARPRVHCKRCAISSRARVCVCVCVCTCLCARACVFVCVFVCARGASCVGAPMVPDSDKCRTRARVRVLLVVHESSVKRPSGA